MELFTIREIKAETAVNGTVPAELHVQVDAVQVKPTRAGGEFLELKLTDAEDSFTLRVWGDSPQFPSARTLTPRTFLAVSGDWATGNYGLEPKSVWTSRSLSDAERATLLCGPPALQEKQAADYGFITESVAGLTDPRLALLCRQFLTDFGERFRRTGAAREYHHARRGGLVEHVAQMMRSAIVLASVYPQANRDLLVAGVLFHDCGKLWENCYEREGFGMPHTLHGELMGHIPMGIELVNRLWQKVAESDEASGWLTLDPPTADVRLHLLHLIGAHHGEYQFGSPVLPRTPEAILLHHVDNIDAKLEMMKDTYATSAMVAADIFERRRPLPTNLVRPLAAYEAPPPRPGPDSEGAGGDGPAEAAGTDGA